MCEVFRRRKAERREKEMLKTYNELYMTLRKQLRDAGVEAHSLEARLLTAHAAGKTPERLLADLQLYSSPAVEERLRALTARRLAGEPAAYILGKWEFYGLELTVTPDVLIPRSDTEVLVDRALELTENRSAETRILDLCTGSGCIGCALGVRLPRSHVVLADLSRAALDVARCNAKDCGLGVRAICTEADALKPPVQQLGSFDLIVSNPPYIERAEIATLDASVRDYEPRMALDGGEDGLDFYRSITRRWSRLLRPGGRLLFEVGETQADAVLELMRGCGFEELAVTEDSGGWRRVVSGRRQD